MTFLQLTVRISRIRTALYGDTILQGSACGAGISTRIKAKYEPQRDIIRNIPFGAYRNHQKHYGKI
jgi:hypothetical protein